MTEFKTLAEFAAFAKARATLVEMAAKEYGVTPAQEWESEYLHPDPNEDDCRFCRAQSTCPAMIRKVQETVGFAFSEIAERDKPLAPPFDRLAQAMSAAGMIEDWIKAVRAEVERRLLAGGTVEGWGLELGREGARRWTDPEEAEKLLRQVFRLPVEVAYDLKVISPTTAEKLTKRKAKNGEDLLIGPGQWTKLKKIIVRSPPSPSVKPSRIIISPYVPGDPTPVDEFEVVQESLS